MEVLPLKSERLQSGSALLPAVARALQQGGLKLKSGDVLVVASKVLAYSQGLLKKVASDEAFRELVRSEADQVLDEGDPPGGGHSMFLTLKNKVLIPNAGIEGVHDEIGSTDLYGRKMVYTKVAVADNLASAANLEMGETNASIPFVLIREAKVTFTDELASAEDYFISPEECLYRELYNLKLRIKN